MGILMESRMFDQEVQKKKRLLEERDALLERLGEDVFERFALPDAFQLLRQEFDSIDITLNELRDRYRALKEERDRTRLDEEDLVQQRSKLEREFNRRVQAPRCDLNEAQLELQYGEDQKKRGRGGKHNLQALKSKVHVIEDQVRDLEREQRVAVKKIDEELALLGERVRKLDITTRGVLEQEEQLGQKRGKRLQDLGRAFYRDLRDEDRYRDLYGELDELHDVLADNRREEPRAPMMEELDSRHRSNHWSWFVFLLLIAVLLGYLYRTQYREQTDLLSSIALNFQVEPVGARTYADLRNIEPLLLTADVPDPTSLPAGSLIFKGLSRADLQELVIDRSPEGEIRFCGLRFQKAPARFGARLAAADWRYLPNKANWRALIDPEDKWLWISLNARAFVLLPADSLGQFEQLTLEPRSEQLYMLRKEDFFDNNDFLLQGLNTLDFRIQDQGFTIDLTTAVLPEDWSERLAWLDQLGSPNPDGPLFTALDNGLRLSGPITSLSIDQYDPSSLVRFVTEQVSTLVHGEDTNEEGNFDTIETQFSGQVLAIYRIGPSQPVRQSLMPFGEKITDLQFLPDHNALLTVDNARREVTRFRFQDGNLTEEHTLALAGDNDAHGLAPTRLVPDPRGELAVLLEAESLEAGRPKVLFLTLNGLSPLTVEELPRQVVGALSASWEPDGQTLFVGCATRRNRRGGTLPGVLVYRIEDGSPRLTRFINLAHEQAPEIWVTGMFTHLPHNALYLYQHPLDQLVRYPLDEGDGRPTPLQVGSGRNDDVLTRGRQADYLSRPLLTNRTHDQAILVHDMDDETTMLYLAELREERPALTDSLSLPFRADAAVRSPLRDVIWLSGSEAGLLGELRIQNRELVLTGTYQTNGITPRVLATGRWGEYLFVVGETTDSAPPL